MSRFRDWLIVKLGGEPRTEVEAQTYALNVQINNLKDDLTAAEQKLANARLKVEIIPTNKPVYTITKTGYISTEEEKNLDIHYVYNEIAEDIAADLMEQHFIAYKVEQSEDGKHITGTVRAVKADEESDS